MARNKGWVKPSNGPYGAPRGNRVMQAKRTTGGSANVILNRHVMRERCSARGCSKPVVMTKPDPISKTRYCLEHLPGQASKDKPISILLDLGAYQTGEVR